MWCKEQEFKKIARKIQMRSFSVVGLQVNSMQLM